MFLVFPNYRLQGRKAPYLSLAPQAQNRARYTEDAQMNLLREGERTPVHPAEMPSELPVTLDITTTPSHHQDHTTPQQQAPWLAAAPEREERSTVLAKAGREEKWRMGRSKKGPDWSHMISSARGKIAHLCLDMH